MEEVNKPGSGVSITQLISPNSDLDADALQIVQGFYFGNAVMTAGPELGDANTPFM